MNSSGEKDYRGRLAPTPSGYLHLGHARTFYTARERALQNRGLLILRNEDLDPQRCKPEYEEAILEDLQWFGLRWREGPDVGGPFQPYAQSRRLDLYRKEWKKLCERGVIYPSPHSRKDVERALNAPQEGDREKIFPTVLRPSPEATFPTADPGIQNWRFRVPDGKRISFQDGAKGLVSFQSGKDFGDFIVWRKDGYPSYEMAVVADDHAMRVTEVVRGEDLLLSTARQLLLYEAFQWSPPRFYHCPLVRDPAGRRLAKRHDSLSLRNLRRKGLEPEAIIASWLF